MSHLSLKHPLFLVLHVKSETKTNPTVVFYTLSNVKVISNYIHVNSSKGVIHNRFPQEAQK